MAKFYDGFVNAVSNLATRWDKASHSTYTADFFNQEEVDNAYRSTWFRKIVDIPAEDAVREGMTWQAEDSQIEKIEAEANRLMMWPKILEVEKLARKDGGAALYMSLPGVAASPATNFTIKHLAVFERSQIQPGQRDIDSLSPTYGQPRKFTVNGIDIHPSRIIWRTGPHKPAQYWDGFGDSMWQVVRAGVVNSDTIAAAVAALVHEAKIDILKLKNLGSNLVTAEYEDILQRRLIATNTLKSLVNAMVIDAEDEWDQKTINFAGFKDIQEMALTIMSGLADIPATRLVGKSPDGMNASGDGDLKNYYDMVSARQKLEIGPAYQPLFEGVIQTSLGSRPPEIYWTWNPLWQLDAKDAATVEKSFADALTARVNTGIFDDVVLAKAELNRMTESGQYPGLEAAIAESDEEDGIKDPDEVEAKNIERMTMEAEIAANAAKPRVAANDKAD